MTARPAELRLRRRGVALVAVALVALAAGEVDAVAAAVAIGVAALALVALATAALAAARRQAAWLVVAEAGALPVQVAPGTSLTMVARVWWPGAGPRAQTGPARGAPPARRLAAAVLASGTLELDDPAARLRLWRRHGVVAVVAGRARVELVAEGPAAGGRAGVPANDRGGLEIGPLGLWAVDPFGLVEVLLGQLGPWRVVVAPVPEPEPLPTRAIAGGGGAGARSTRLVHGELAGLEAVRGSEAPGPVHWPTTLRTGHLVVRRFAAEDPSELVLHLDLRPQVHIAASVDAVVAAAGALAAAGLAAGRTVQLGGDGQPGLRVPPGPAALATVGAWLALVDAVPAAGGGRPLSATRQAATVITTEAGRPAWNGTGAQVLVVGMAGTGRTADAGSPETAGPGTPKTPGPGTADPLRALRAGRR